MQAIIDLLNDYLANEQVLRWTVVILFATVIFVFGIGVSVILLGVTDPIRRRLGMVDKTEAPKGTMSPFQSFTLAFRSKGAATEFKRSLIDFSCVSAEKGPIRGSSASDRLLFRPILSTSQPFP